MPAGLGFGFFFFRNFTFFGDLLFLHAVDTCTGMHEGTPPSWKKMLSSQAFWCKRLAQPHMEK